MAAVTKINVQHVRAHKMYSLELSPGVTVITGPNGSGKTSLIEALYIALQGSSFKGGDLEIIEHDAPWYRIDVQFNDGITRSVKFDPERTTGRKQFIVDSKTQYRLSAQNKHPVVLFEPEDLRLLNGSPTRRRQFIDRFISQLDPEYALSLRRYERALKQRNNLLKRASLDDSLFAWDVSLSEYGAYIVNRRHHFVMMLNERLNGIYTTISHTHDIVSVGYSEPDHDNMKQKLLSELNGRQEHDRLLGYTSVGPHRHDVLFHFNGSPALTVVSRGEARSIVLALKTLEAEIVEQQTGIKPVILLDDVYGELDKSRQKYLTDLFQDNQIIITSAVARKSPYLTVTLD